jgi:hypothetical protein
MELAFTRGVLEKASEVLDISGFSRRKEGHFLFSL